MLLQICVCVGYIGRIIVPFRVDDYFSQVMRRVRNQGLFREMLSDVFRMVYARQRLYRYMAVLVIFVNMSASIRCTAV